MDTKGVFTDHKIIYYFNFHYKLNHIEYFWYDKKNQTWKHCKYSFDRFKKDVQKSLNQVKHYTILRQYNNYLKKIDLYKKKYNIE